MLDDAAAGSLLAPGDPAPVGIAEAGAASPFVLVCDHAGNAVPERLAALGLPPAELDRHIGIDIGALGVAERLAERLGSTLVWQRYSRLVVDCNRQPQAPGAMVEIADGTVVPGNRGLTADARAARLREIHAPYHTAIAGALDERQARGLSTIVVSLHSFTPRLLARPSERPWPVALCWGRDDRFARRVHAALVAGTAGLLVGQNEPYTVDMVEDYTIPVHGEGRGLAYVEIEVRQDQLGDAAGQAGWADRLAVALSRAVEGFARVRGEG